MANSLRFRKLCSELKRLRLHFLPSKWEPTGVYSERKLDRTRAFRILAHAEIESFIEEILRDVITEKHSNWARTKKPNYVMMCLVTVCKFGWQDIEAKEVGLEAIEPKKIKDEDSISRIVELAFDQYLEILKDNHGIMSKNLKRLLMPIGIELSDLDQTWLINMNSFGGQRGFAAHTSRLGVTTLPDPQSVKKQVDDLLSGLKALDEAVLKIKNGS